MITLIDYGMGNLRSVCKALEYLGQEVQITAEPGEILAAERVILPGVGAFGDAMAELHRRGLVQPIKDYVNSGRLFLGVCLGMQLLLEASEEAPGVPGLGLIRGQVRRFTTNFKVPHMGWNTVRQVRPSPLFNELADGEHFYFVHSFYVAPEDPAAVAGVTDYDGEFTSVLTQCNVMATQFHPEKSQQRGLQMLKNFCAVETGAFSR